MSDASERRELGPLPALPDGWQSLAEKYDITVENRSPDKVFPALVPHVIVRCRTCDDSWCHPMQAPSVGVALRLLDHHASHVETPRETRARRRRGDS